MAAQRNLDAFFGKRAAATNRARSVQYSQTQNGEEPGNEGEGVPPKQERGSAATVEKRGLTSSKRRIIESSDDEAEVSTTEKSTDAAPKKMKTDGDAGRDSEPGPSPGIEKVIMSQKAAAETVSSAAKISSDQKEILHRAQREAKGTKGQGLMFAALCETFSKIEETTGRLEIMEHLTQLFLRIIESNPTDLVRAVYLCVSRVAPEYEGIELGIGESLLMKAIAAATGRTVPKVKENLAQLGDLGKVAEACRGKQRTMFAPKPLLVEKVFGTFREIAQMKGGSSMQKKVDKISGLLVSCKGIEARYMMRLLEGKLRIGLAEQTVLAALGHSSALYHHQRANDSDNEVSEEVLREAVATMKSVFNEMPDYEAIAPILIEKGYKDLPKYCKLTPGIPVKPMLAHPTKSISEILDRFENIKFTCEFKYDGERAQVHQIEDGRCMVFSRNLENTSVKYSDIVDAAKSYAKPQTSSFILDCEAVAWDREKQCILPFQILTTRKRKDVREEDIKVRVCLFAFDLLYLNGRCLLREPLEERRRLLGESFEVKDGHFQLALARDLESTEEIQAFLDESIESNCEGLIIKTLQGDESSYEPSKRSRNWLKLKKDYLAGIGDSLDLVVIGAYTGKGKRTGVYGGYLLACYDKDSETFQTICKIGTGFSEADLGSHKEDLEPYIIPAPKPYYSYGEGTDKPDVWFEPTKVWEVKAADLSISPVYRAAVGLVDPTKGVSLRFPRFIRVREDKEAEDATTSEQVAEMYKNQKINRKDDQL